ncbi:MAG: ABC transporter permease [Planctomycetota bacterium]|jgi:putative ABC transport system permease protein|nr:ABC transporter permease [Planctomycetota bacterium]
MGGTWLMVRRSLAQHLLSTCVTVLATALASGLVMSVFALATQSQRAFVGVPSGFNAVLGARGSQLQLVLATVFHLETLPGNIPWSMYKEIEKDPAIELAIPYAVGDNYFGFRIVGTTRDYFESVQFREGERFEVYEGGDFFDPTLREAVIGSLVARELNLTVRSTIYAYHGTAFDAQAKHEEPFRVIGILKPTNSPADWVIWIPIDAIFSMTGHVLRGSGENYEAKKGETIPDEHKEVSAVMLKLRTHKAGMLLSQRINRQGNLATLAWPIGNTMAQFFSKLAWMNGILQVVAYLVVVVAAGAILAAIYNSINERRREFAIMRALGAGRRTVFSAIVVESGTIAAIGTLAGFAVYLTIMFGAASVIRTQTGVVIDVWQPHAALLYTPIGMVLVGCLAGILPAFKAYSTDVATNLVPTT